MECPGIKNFNAFGWELMLDLYGCDLEVISSREKIVGFVKELCDLIQMKRYGEPWAERFGLAKVETAGHTVVQLIETSSIVAHFSEFKRSVYFEIFSCKPYNKDQVVEFAKNYFKADRVVENFLERE